LHPQPFHLVNHDQFQPGFPGCFLRFCWKKLVTVSVMLPA
jgi:hypothetical protein